MGQPKEVDILDMGDKEFGDYPDDAVFVLDESPYTAEAQLERIQKEKKEI